MRRGGGGGGAEEVVSSRCGEVDVGDDAAEEHGQLDQSGRPVVVVPAAEQQPSSSTAAVSVPVPAPPMYPATTTTPLESGDEKKDTKEDLSTRPPTTKKRMAKKKKDSTASPLYFPVAIFFLPCTILTLVLFYSRGFYQESPSVITRHHVTIVGGGVSGVLTAYLLDKYGGGKYEIDLFEEEGHLGGAARPLFFGDDGEERVETAFLVFNHKYHLFQILLKELGVQQRRPDWATAGRLEWHPVDDGRNITLLNSDRSTESYLRDEGTLHLLMQCITEYPLAFLAETSVEDYLASQGFTDAFRTNIMSILNLFISGEVNMNLQAFITYYKTNFLASAPGGGGSSDMWLEDRNDAHILLMANQTSSRVRYHLNSKVEYFDPSRKELGVVGGGVWEYDSIVLACRKGAVPEMLRGHYGGSEEYTRGFLDWLGLLRYKEYVTLSRRHPSPDHTFEIRFNRTESYIGFPPHPTILQGFVGGSSAYIDRFLDGATSGDILDYKVWPHVQSDRYMTLFQRNFHKFQYNYDTSFVGADGLFTTHEVAVASAYVVAQDMYGIKFPYEDIVAAKAAFDGIRHLTNFGILYH